MLVVTIMSRKCCIAVAQSRIQYQKRNLEAEQKNDKTNDHENCFFYLFQR